MNSREKKISLPEMIIMGMLVISAYFFGLVVDLAGLSLVGQILHVFDWGWDLIVLAITQFWLIMKGGIAVSRQVTMLGGNLFEGIPYANILPVAPIIFFVTIYLINHPKIMEKVGKLAPVEDVSRKPPAPTPLPRPTSANTTENKPNTGEIPK